MPNHIAQPKLCDAVHVGSARSSIIYYLQEVMLFQHSMYDVHVSVFCRCTEREEAFICPSCNDVFLLGQFSLILLDNIQINSLQFYLDSKLISY